MSTTDEVPFRLATLVREGGLPVVAMVIGDRAISIHDAQRALAKNQTRELDLVGGLLGLLPNWERNFAVLKEIAAVVSSETLDAERFARYAFDPRSLRTLPPILRPSKIMCAAQNYPTHLEEMKAFQGSVPANADLPGAGHGDVAARGPYLWLKAPSSQCGAYDDIELPTADSKVDWEVEMAVVIGKLGRKISCDKAIEHVAGFLTMNDVSRRDTLLRPDRPGLRSDWFASKSHDGFAPMGPYFVPREFVNHQHLRLHLSVNDVTKQDGNTANLIFSPEEQIEYASSVLTLEPGDVLATGTCGGVGQATNTFINPGDIVVAEVEHLGALRNRFVAATSPSP